jgi:hypothetical protein
MLGSEIDAKNRFLSITAGDPGHQQAIRVTFVDLPPPYDNWNGLKLFVGERFDACEGGGRGPPGPGLSCGGGFDLVQNWFWVAPLVCDPVSAHFMDWSTLATGYCEGSSSPCITDADCGVSTCGTNGVVHLFHEGIVPRGVYKIQVVDSECDLDSESDYSGPLTLAQPRWGDVVKDCTTNPCGVPDGVVRITDAVAILDKFVNLPGAPRKARCDLAGNPPNGGVLDFIIGINDVTWCLDAFIGAQYPFPPPDDPCP